MRNEAGVAEISAFRQDVPNYTPFTHCTTSARDVVIDGFGISLASRRGPIRVGEHEIPFSWTNPQAFDEALQDSGYEAVVIATSEFKLNAVC